MSEGHILFRRTLGERTVREGQDPAAAVPMRMGTAGLGLLVNDHREATRILSDVETYGSAGELMASVFDEPDDFASGTRRPRRSSRSTRPTGKSTVAYGARLGGSSTPACATSWTS